VFLILLVTSTLALTSILAHYKIHTLLISCFTVQAPDPFHTDTILLTKQLEEVYGTEPSTSLRIPWFVVTIPDFTVFEDATETQTERDGRWTREPRDQHYKTLLSRNFNLRRSKLVRLTTGDIIMDLNKWDCISQLCI
jgi:hypothetical protein